MGSTGEAEVLADISADEAEPEAGGKRSAGIVKIFGGDGESQIDLAEIQKQMEKSEQERTAKRIDARIATLTKKLGLSDDQATQVRALLEKEASLKSGALTSLIGSAIGAASGGSDDIEITEIIGAGDATGEGDGDGFDFDTELAALLDDDQKAAYAAHLEAQNENYIEATAGGQLAQLQTTIPDLSSEQKDRAFEEFARIAREDVDANGAPATDDGFDFRRMMRQRSAEKEAMQEILTAEQMEVYESNNASSISIGGSPGAAVFTSGIRVESSVDLTTPDPPADDSE